MNRCSGKYSEEDITLRPVTENDIKKIYEWRNLQEVRKVSLDDRKISWDEHIKFWNDYLKNKKGYAFIIEYNGIDCGVIRLDMKKNNKAEVSIIISPKFQGIGIGTKSLNLACKIARRLNIKGLTARIKPNNKKSINIFIKNNFKLKYNCYELELDN